MADAAIVAEGAFRRGFHQGYEAGRRGDDLAFELLRWRFAFNPANSPEQLGSGRTIPAVDRLRMQAQWFIDKIRGAVADCPRQTK